MLKYFFVILFSLMSICSYAQNAKQLLDFVTTEEKGQLDVINHSVMAFEHGNYKYGLKLLKKKMKKDGDFYDGILFQAYGERQIQNLKNAIQYLNKSIALNPKAPIAYFLRGNTYMDIANYRLALTDYKKCIKLDSSFLPAYNNLALVRIFNQGKAKAHKNDFKMAKSELSLLQNCDEDNAGIEEVYFNLGLISMHLNKYYDAICCFSKAEGSEKMKNKSIYYNGVCKFNIKLYEDAVTDFEKSQTNNYRSEECEKYLSLINLISQNKNE
ncbi:MAG: hypothetical protein COB15_03115 [Flavobacteriales bacterium]|nr:MAG: hypothetical protein COB15_03115 [Flavobacteriales bacterium]